MARQTLTKTTAPGGYASDGVTATMTAADASNKEEFISTGKELVIAHNSGATPRAITISSVANSKGRTLDVTDTVAAGAIHIYGPFPRAGWAQSNGKIYLEAAHAELKWGIVQLP